MSIEVKREGTLNSFKSRDVFRLIKLMRVQHWIKNLLIFAPLVFLHPSQWSEAIPLFIGFVSFCLVASGVYITNDYFDLEFDKQHPLKKSRPLAAGEISSNLAIATAGTLFSMGFLLSLILPLPFRIVLCLYVALNLVYSWYFKKVFLLDIFLVATFHFCRIWAAYTISDALLSPLQALFFVALFLNFSFLKRTAEVIGHQDSPYLLPGRSYSAHHERLLLLFGILFAFIASATYFILFPKLSSILMAIWLLRLWWIVAHKKLTTDLFAFAIKDPLPYLVLLFQTIL